MKNKQETKRKKKTKIRENVTRKPKEKKKKLRLAAPHFDNKHSIKSKANRKNENTQGKSKRDHITAKPHYSLEKPFFCIVAAVSFTYAIHLFIHSLFTSTKSNWENCSKARQSKLGTEANGCGRRCWLESVHLFVVLQRANCLSLRLQLLWFLLGSRNCCTGNSRSDLKLN